MSQLSTNAGEIYFVVSDINECTEGLPGCHADAECINNQGSYNCKCKDGLAGDGITCVGNYWILLYDAWENLFFPMEEVHKAWLNN